MGEEWKQEWQNFNANAPLQVATEPQEVRILRVNQLDAERLDFEISYTLNAYFKRIFLFFDPTIIGRIQPELTAILQALIYRFSVYEKDQSFGDRMQNLIYKRNGSEPPSKFRKIIHASLLIVLPYIHARLNKILTEHEGDENVWWLGGKSHVEVWRKLNALEMYVKLAQMINFLVFIVNGRYRNIADRIMGMRLIFARRLMLRQVSFDYMNRELVWNGFAEIIFFLFPLINFSKLRNWLHLLLFSGFNSTSAQNRKKQKLPAITNTACPICGDEAIQVPYCATSCKHVFCYFCIQSALMTEPSHTIICKLCGETITRITRVVANKS